MKYWAVMEFLTPETTDRVGVASLVQSIEEVIDVATALPADLAIQ
jgi:hypothetical protein